MKFARIKDTNGNLIIASNSVELRVNAEKFDTKDKAQNYLDKLESNLGLEGLEYCCAYGACKSSVNFRKESPKIAGKRSRGRPQTWASKKHY